VFPDESERDITAVVDACLRGDHPAAWEEFVGRTQRLIASTIIKVASAWGPPSKHVVDDLVQDVYLKLCKDEARILREFEAQHEGAIFGFLKVVAANTTRDHFKASSAAKRQGDKVADSVDVADQADVPGTPSTMSTADRELLIRDIDRILCQSLSPDTRDRDRLVFWLHYRTGLTAQAIAARRPIGLSVKGVESLLRRLTALVRSHVSAPQSSRRIPPEELVVGEE
jgi:RNA polymerase sigma-70 factor (ECF subfamily)